MAGQKEKKAGKMAGHYRSINSLLQPWNRMPEEETEGTRHAKSCQQADDYVLDLEEPKEKRECNRRVDGNICSISRLPSVESVNER